MKRALQNIPILGRIGVQLYRRLWPQGGWRSFGSEAYWERRYAAGGDSGSGSSGKLAAFKAEVINQFIADHAVASVIEFGCGDGRQLALAEYPDYSGFDVSATAIASCRQRFSSDHLKRFWLMREYNGERASLVLSLDVIYHLVEDDVFENYLSIVFKASERYVIVYASDIDDLRRKDSHVRHRKFTRWVTSNMTDWKLIAQRPNRYPSQGDYRDGSLAEFFIYEKA